MPLSPDSLDKFKRPAVAEPPPPQPTSITSFVENHVISHLGKPPGHTRTTVKEVGDNAFRVNVWSGPVVTDSFYVTHLDDEIVSNPEIIRRYPE